MEKQIRRFKVDFNFNWTYGVKIDKLKEDIKKLEDLGVTEVSIEPDEDYYGNSIVTIVALAERLETDEEAKKRIDKENKNREDSEKRDLELYKRLKTKYDGKSL